MSAYHGPFLAGFHLSGGEEFERWVDGERARLGRMYAQALEQLAEQPAQAGELTKAVEWWSRLAREGPYNSRIALRYMRALEGAGDRAGALRHATAHADLLRAELDAVPEREVVALAERLRLESHGAPRICAGPTDLGRFRLARRHEPGAPFGCFGARPGNSPRLGSSGACRRCRAGRGGSGWSGWWGALARTAAGPVPNVSPSPSFANHTGRPDLDDLGVMAADWIVRGLMETPVVDVTDVEALYADGQYRSEGPMDPRRSRAGTAPGWRYGGATIARVTASVPGRHHRRRQWPGPQVAGAGRHIAGDTYRRTGGAAGENRGGSQPAGECSSGLSRRPRAGGAAELRRLPRVRGGSQTGSIRWPGGAGRAPPPGGETGLDLRCTAGPARVPCDLERRLCPDGLDRWRARGPHR